MKRATITLIAVGGALALSACSPASILNPKADAAQISIAPGDGSKAVNPANPVTVSVTHGKLSAVTVTDGDGTKIAGAIAVDGHSWTATKNLEYGTTYTATANATNDDNVAVTSTATFSTVKPENLTLPYIQIADGGTYGVGQIVPVHFDEKITDKAAAEKALHVTTSPAVEGSWYWLNDQDVHWRPQAYFASGTKVTVSADVYGIKVGDGLYGQSDVTKSYTIGASHIAKVTDAEKMIRVYENGKLVRTMPTSMGMGGTKEINGRTLSFWTNSGPHIVLGKQNPVLMDSSTYGLPTTDPLGYKEKIPFAVQISVDGEYVHWAPWSVWAQGNTNTSHGCLNVSPEDAEWFYNFSQQGDIVDVEGTPRDLAVWNAGDWSVSWSDWLAGSALS